MKFIHTFFLICMLWSLGLSAAQAQTTDYSGTVNGNLKIQMQLKYMGEEMLPSGLPRAFYEGWYYYESQGSSKKIILTGSYFGGQMMLTEEADGRITGYFELTADGNSGMKGQWQSTTGKTMPAVLKVK